MTSNLKKVSSAEFFATVGQLNVHPRITNSKYPYTSDWQMLNGSEKLMGRSVGRLEGGMEVTDWFVVQS